MIPRLPPSRSLVSLDDCGQRISRLNIPCDDVRMDPSVLRDKLLNGSVLDARDLMAGCGIALDTPLFPDSHTLLTFAIAFEPEAVEKLLQDTRVDMNAADGYGDLPLVLALRNRPLFTALMARSKANINLRNKRGNTALIEAAAVGELVAVELLLGDRRLDIDAHEQGIGALRRAAAAHRIDIVKALACAVGDESLFAGNDVEAEPVPLPKRMRAPEAWKLLDAEPCLYATEQGPVAISNARELTVLYMRRLKDASTIEDEGHRTLYERAIGQAYTALLPEFKKQPK